MWLWAAAICLGLWGATPAFTERASAQAPLGAVVEVNPISNALVIEPLNGVSNTLLIGYNPDPQFTYVFDPLQPLQPQSLCQLLNSGFRHLVACPPAPSISGLQLQLQALASNKVQVLPTVPVLPGPNLIQGGKKRDVIQGGRSDERINSGKGDDTVNPGKGKDVANLGPGDDKANTRDGKPDKVNGGPGDDQAVVDKKDKVKNVELVKRK